MPGTVLDAQGGISTEQDIVSRCTSIANGSAVGQQKQADVTVIGAIIKKYAKQNRTIKWVQEIWVQELRKAFKESAFKA